MSKKVMALIDCNNFYVSCERVFNAALQKKPTIVLSNNDSCVVARSNEVKKLDIKMGQPVFEIEGLIRKHHIQVFSSNHSLYADMSDRVMTVLSQFSPHMEIYSIVSGSKVPGSLVASQRFKGGKFWAVALGGAASAAAIDGLSNKEVVRCLGIPAKLNACSEGSRTAFRDDSEHHRSVATLASRLCWKVFGFVK
jgi:hypothetical protein